MLRVGRVGVGAFILTGLDIVSTSGLGFVLLAVDGVLYLVGYIRSEGEAP